jgi:MFS family permease
MPDSMKGRALSLYTMTFRGMPALGALLFGALGELTSLRQVFSILAIFMLGFSLTVFNAVRKRGG